jgi:hypothetical protein
MNTLLYLIAILLCGKQIWNLVLKDPSYTSQISLKLIRTHALILWLISINTLFALGTLIGLFRDPSRVLESNNKTYALATLIYCVSGTLLIPIWLGMANRKKIMLKLYYIVWPLTFLSLGCAIATNNHSYLRYGFITYSIVFLFPLCVFFITLNFYIKFSKKLHFE